MWRLVRAAFVFEEKGKAHVMGKRINLMINLRFGSALANELEREFGGKVYQFGIDQCRWQVNGSGLFEFLDRIERYLSDEGKTKAANIRALQEQLDGTRVNKPIGAPATPEVRADAFQLMDGVDEDQLDLLELDWDSFPKDDVGRALLRSKSKQHTHAWMVALQERGLTATVTGDTLLHVDRRVNELKRRNA
jgi:hypothetical protein